MSAPVSFISPLKILASMVTSSTAVVRLPGESDWDAGATYQMGDIVFRPGLGRRFENQIPGVDATLPEDDKDRWYDLGATDKMAMFDGEASTQSIAPGALTTVFRPGAFNAMFLGGLDGTSLAVTIKDAPGGAVVYSYSGSLEDSEPADYYEWCFSPFRPKTDFFAFNLPPYALCEVTVTVANPSGVGRCGIASVGDLISLEGEVLQGATVEPKSYARITTDKRGKTSIEPGKAARDLTVSAQIPIARARDVDRALTDVMGVPCPWICSDAVHLEGLRTFGLGNGKLTYNKPTIVTLTLSVQGMI